MLAWGWVIIIAMLSGSFGVLLMAIIISGARRDEQKPLQFSGYLHVEIIEDRRAEKTGVEFAGQKFAFLDRLGLPIVDILSSFANAIGMKAYHTLPEKPIDRLIRIHKITIRENNDVRRNPNNSEIYKAKSLA